MGYLQLTPNSTCRIVTAESESMGTLRTASLFLSLYPIYPNVRKKVWLRYFHLVISGQGPAPVLIHENKKFLQFLRHASPRHSSNNIQQ